MGTATVVEDTGVQVIIGALHGTGVRGMGPGAIVKGLGLVVAIGPTQPSRRKSYIQAPRGSLLFEGCRYCLNSERPEVADSRRKGTPHQRRFLCTGNGSCGYK